MGVRAPPTLTRPGRGRLRWRSGRRPRPRAGGRARPRPAPRAAGARPPAPAGGSRRASVPVSGNPAVDRWIASTATGTDLTEGAAQGITEGAVCPDKEKSIQIGPLAAVWSLNPAAQGSDSLRCSLIPHFRLSPGAIQASSGGCRLRCAGPEKAGSQRRLVHGADSSTAPTRPQRRRMSQDCGLAPQWERSDCPANPIVRQSRFDVTHTRMFITILQLKSFEAQGRLRQNGRRFRKWIRIRLHISVLS